MRREAKIMQMIRHPNIVQLLEVVETEHRLVILICNQKLKFPINEDMLFRLVTIIYFTVLGNSLTHTSLFSTKYSISILLLEFSASQPLFPGPPARHMRAWAFRRLICVTRQLPKKRHGLYMKL